MTGTGTLASAMGSTRWGRASRDKRKRAGVVLQASKRAGACKAPRFGPLAMLAVLGWGAMGHACAQEGKFTWQMTDERLKGSQTVSALGPDFAGDQVSLSNGGLSFSATDVSLPGNDALQVALTRVYAIKNWKAIAADGMLADWNFQLPNISGDFTTDWVLPGTTPGDRCSNTGFPALPGGGYTYADFWRGLTITLPDGNSTDLEVAASNIPTPSVGGPYPWVAQHGQVRLSCLASIKNGTGQGFLALLPDGSKIWYDWMAQAPLPGLKGNRLGGSAGTTPVYQVQARRTNALYATRVEDRYGNAVSYSYANAWDKPARLTKIQASDGRQLTVSYANDAVASVSDGAHVWTYAYGTGQKSKKSLVSVTLPDGSAWNIDLLQLTGAEIEHNETAFDEPLRSCTTPEIPVNYAAQPMASITHPAGAKATFTLALLEHGRSNVPVSCGHVTTTPVGAAPGTGNNPNDDVNNYAISDYSFTLVQKRVTGPGQADAVWSYSYEPGISVHRYPGTTRQYPVCDASSQPCSAPPCVSEACAGFSRTTVSGPGEWMRYTHGNSYRYNEGLLLKVETGTDAAHILRTITHQYDLTLGTISRPYPASYGTGLKPGYDSFPDEQSRPLTGTTTLQQGRAFIRRVDTFDGLARPVQVTRTSQPAP